MGYTVISMDEASYIIGWNTRNGWYPVGMPVTTPVSLSGKRFHPLGALHKEVCLPVCRQGRQRELYRVPGEAA